MWALNGSYKLGTRGGLFFSGPGSPLLLGHTPPLRYLLLFLLSLLLPLFSPFQACDLKHRWVHPSDEIMAFRLLKTLRGSCVSTAVKHERAGTDAGAALLGNNCYLENNENNEEEDRSHRLPHCNMKLSDADPHSLTADHPQGWGRLSPPVAFSNILSCVNNVIIQQTIPFTLHIIIVNLKALISAALKMCKRRSEMSSSLALKCLIQVEIITFHHIKQKSCLDWKFITLLVAHTYIYTRTNDYFQITFSNNWLIICQKMVKKVSQRPTLLV